MCHSSNVLKLLFSADETGIDPVGYTKKSFLLNFERVILKKILLEDTHPSFPDIVEKIIVKDVDKNLRGSFLNTLNLSFVIRGVGNYR